MAGTDVKTKKALRLVLLGWAKSGKSASANTILGHTEFITGFTTSKCLSGHAEVAGRQVTVVDTPGWVSFSLDDIDEGMREQIISSATPEPDAVLLLIPLHIAIIAPYVQSLADHVSLLGDNVWGRTVVLFTFGDCLKTETIMEHMGRNQLLIYLSELCGDRYHVFDNSKQRDVEQVEKLLRTVEGLVANRVLSQATEVVKSVFEDDEETEKEEAQEDPDDICEKRSEDVNQGCPETDWALKKAIEKEDMVFEEYDETENEEVQEELQNICKKRNEDVDQGCPELRVVLLGLSQSGKSSTGNTILESPKKFGAWTARSQLEEAVVAGRRLVVLDTPPWQIDTEISPDQNVVNWICQCPPGPHALLLNVNLSSTFKEPQWKCVQRYMGLLGEGAWEHVIVVFTGGDVIQGLNAEHHIRSKGPFLQTLLKMCANRFYIFNNRRGGDRAQVTDLLDGVEKLSSRHSPGYFQMNQAIAAGMEEASRALLEKAQRRIEMVAGRERAHEAVFLERNAHRLREIRMVLLGERRSGKSTAAKTIAKLEFQEDKKKCAAASTVIDGRIVLVVDTPGWMINQWKKVPQNPPSETITEALLLCHPGPHAFLIAVSLRRSFTEKHRLAVEENLACLSKDMWTKAMVLFTCGEELRGEAIETHIEKEGKHLKWLVEKCDNRYHVFSDNWFDDLQVRELLRCIDKMVMVNSNQFFTNIPTKHRKGAHGSALRSHPEEWETQNENIDDYDDDDDNDHAEFTPRERKMMDRMKKEIQDRLLIEIKAYLQPYMKVLRSLPFDPPSLSGSMQRPLEDELSRRWKGVQHPADGSSGVSTMTQTDMDDAEDTASVSTPGREELLDGREVGGMLLC